MPNKKAKLQHLPTKAPEGDAKGSSYSNTFTMEERMFKRLMKLRKEAVVEHVYYDLLAVFLMQEFPGIHIEEIITMIKEAFETSPPQVMLHKQYQDAVLQVEKTILKYKTHPPSDDPIPKPFCLRFPTHADVLKHAISLEGQCRLLDTQKMVILLDESGRCCGVGVPRLEENLLSVHPSAEKSWPTTPYPLNESNKGTKRIAKGLEEDAKAASVLFQTYGYGEGAKNYKGVSDLKIKHYNKKIVVSQLQGIDPIWKEEKTPPALPNPLRKDPRHEVLDSGIFLKNNMAYYAILSLWINKGFLSQASEVAEKGVRYLQKWGSEHLKANFSRELNPIVASRTISVNLQVQTHCDFNNSFLFDSVFFFGNHKGGEFILPSLGVAYFGGSGYSFHGPMKILWHGVGKFGFEDHKEKPRQFSVAFWSRASSFAAIARHEAYRTGNQKLSASSYWLPIYPVYDGTKVEKIWSDQKYLVRQEHKEMKQKNKLPN
ncbi:hypothetical protein PtA15_10A272 [Puccinia triticina]|uniref:Uncharacterized protein n=2 Tax=Puccinia triticina TaxID=208348 RepID=A0ABY7CU69_9BASI|nr:uncharacterized protein PtA15_10A272 [Puccinia triticina]WAQ88851.1 hypothetical protein PtA15_10A272 [Puccinia triticina]